MGSSCQKFPHNTIRYQETYTFQLSDQPNSFPSQKSDSYKSGSQNHIGHSSKEIYSQVFQNSNNNNIPLDDQVIQDILSRTEIFKNDESASTKEKVFSKSRNLGIVDFGPQPEVTSLTQCYYKNNYLEQEDMALIIPNFFELEILNEKWQKIMHQNKKTNSHKKNNPTKEFSKLKEDKNQSLDTQSQYTTKTLKTNKTSKTVSFAVQQFKERTKRHQTLME